MFPFPSEEFLERIAEYFFVDEVSMLVIVKKYVSILTKALDAFIKQEQLRLVVAGYQICKK